MSLACFECGRGGSFDTILVKVGKDKNTMNRPISSFPNFYTCCAKLEDFKEISRGKTNYAIIREKCAQDSWNTGNDGPSFNQVEVKFIDEKDLANKLPKIYKALESTKG